MPQQAWQQGRIVAAPAPMEREATECGRCTLAASLDGRTQCVVECGGVYEVFTLTTGRIKCLCAECAEDA